MIVTYLCHRCETPIEGPFMVDANDRDLCRACANIVPCAFCDKPTTADDSMPYKDGRAHSACALKVTNALGLERSATLLRRSGFRGAS